MRTMTLVVNPSRRPWWGPVLAAVLAALFLAGWLLYSRLAENNHTPQARLEAQYGLRVTMVATTMMGSLVDMRFKVIDADKAQLLLGDENNTPYLLVGNQERTVILPANYHSHSYLTGRTYSLFYPNPHLTVRSGVPVSVVFGDMVTEALITR